MFASSSSELDLKKSRKFVGFPFVVWFRFRAGGERVLALTNRSRSDVCTRLTVSLSLSHDDDYMYVSLGSDQIEKENHQENRRTETKNFN